MVQRAVLERDEFRKQAEQVVDTATAEVVGLERQNKKLAQTLVVLPANEDFDIADFEKHG